MADRTVFTLRPTAGARPLDAATVERIARVAGAQVGETGEDGSARLAFDPARDADAVRGALQLAARVELGAHWQTRYALEPS